MNIYKNSDIQAIEPRMTVLENDVSLLQSVFRLSQNEKRSFYSDFHQSHTKWRLFLTKWRPSQNERRSFYSDFHQSHTKWRLSLTVWRKFWEINHIIAASDVID